MPPSRTQEALRSHPNLECGNSAAAFFNDSHDSISDEAH